MTCVRQGRVLFWIPMAAAIGLTSCSTVDTVDKPRPDSTYIYGRFSIGTTGSAFLSMGAVGNASLVVKCDSGDEIYFTFREDNAVQLRRLKPSQCALAEMVFESGIGMTLKRQPTRIAGVKIYLTAGKAHYIGDWGLVVDRQMDAGKMRSHMTWKVVDRYEATTQIVKATYPLFSTFVTENRLEPPGSDEFVNCVSKGKRTWTYHSNCD